MRKFIQNKLKEQKGLTLIELLAVIVILAIIAAIAIPAIGGIIENSRVGAIKSDATNIINAAELYNTESVSQPKVTLTQLEAAGFLDEAGSFKNVANKDNVFVEFPGGNFTGIGTNKNVIVSFTATPKASIAELKNSQANTSGALALTPGGTVTISGR